MSIAELWLAYSCVALQAILLGAMLWHKTLKWLPWFFSYLFINFVFGIVLLTIRHKEYAYTVVYWIGDAFVTFLILLAIYETFRLVFLKFYAMRWFRVVFPAVTVALIGFGSLRAFWHSGSAETTSLVVSQIYYFEITAGILQVGIFFLFLVLVQFFRLPWKQYTFGIALGFGVSAAGSLVAFMVRSEFGTKFDPIFRFVVPLTYTIGVAIWLLTFLWPVPKASSVATPALTPEAVVDELKQYTRTVKEILKR
jgi:hypothetical protein